MGINRAPLLVDLLLYSYETDLLYNNIVCIWSVYIPSWYDIPELQFPFKISLVEGCCFKGSFKGSNWSVEVIPLESFPDEFWLLVCVTNDYGCVPIVETKFNDSLLRRLSLPRMIRVNKFEFTIGKTTSSMFSTVFISPGTKRPHVSLCHYLVSFVVVNYIYILRIFSSANTG